MNKVKPPIKIYFVLFVSVLLIFTSMALTTMNSHAEEDLLEKRYDFGPEDKEPVDGFEKVTDQAEYNEETGYGFSDIENVTADSRDSDDNIKGDFVSFTETAFKVDLPNGDYEVSLIAGDEEEEIEVGVKAESIQKIEDTSVKAGEFVEEDFEIALIDGQLIIELTGENPKINALIIRELPTRSSADHPSVYIASDSTAQTYDAYWKPQAGWGQMLDRYFSSDVVIDNHAIGGRSSKTFYTEGRLDTILRDIQPKDYVFIQFGHNDSTKSRPERYVTVEQYKEYLETYVTGIRQRDGIPVLITPVGRRDFNSETNQFNVSFPEYVEGMEEVAADLDVLLVDLSTLSREYYNEIGLEGSRSVFLHADAGLYEAYPDGVQDDTHFQAYGAIQIARLLSEGIERLDTKLSDYVRDIEMPETVPEKPTGVKASSISNAGAFLTWDEAGGADIYRIYRKAEGDSNYDLVSTSTVPQINLTGLDEGSAYDIVVTAVNGKGESERSEAIEIRTKEATLKFDFGIEGSPVGDGYTEVNLSTLYTEEQGYGIVDSEGMIGRDRENDDPVLRDWLGYFDVGWDFNVDVPNGFYAVKVYVGDFLGSARTDLAIDDEEYGTISAPKEGTTEKVIPQVEVTNGQMNFHFGGTTGIANGLELTPILLAPSGLSLDDQSFEPDNVSASISWESVDGASSYSVYRKIDGSNDVELIDTTEEENYTDKTVVVGNEYEYTVTTIDNIDTETAPSSPLFVSMIDEEDDISEWDAGKAYVGGEKVTYEGKQYEALWWTQGETPGESTVWSQVVEQGDDWVKNNIYVSGDQVSFDGSTYKAQWWTQGEIPGEADVWILVD